ncbi:MAG: GspH/FimT family protein, partial [Planctomycetota bacterium]
GFTLVELVIVLLLIGIASGLVSIYVGKSSGSLEIKKFSKDLYSVLRYARTRAVSEKQKYCFVIDKNDGKYRLYTDSNTADKEEEAPVPVLDKLIPEDVQVIMDGSVEDQHYIEFFPRGNTSGGVIEIKNEKGTTYFITVNKITGKVRMD